MADTILPLNDTVVVFLHPEDTLLSHPHVVQVTIKTDGTYTSHATRAAFRAAQKEISTLIVKIVTAHLHDPLPPFFILEEDRYTLVARHRKWPFGREKLKFSWGGEKIYACEDKWSFVFDPVAAPSSDSGLG